MTDLAASSTGASSTSGGQSGFDFTTLLKDLLSGAGAYSAWNAAGNNDKNIANLASQLTTKAPPASATANGGTSTYNNGNLTLDNGTGNAIQSLFQGNATQNLNTANGLNPAVTSAAQGVTDATSKNYDDVYNSTLAAIRGQLADTQTKTWNNLASNLFSTGNLGSTGGAQQTQAFFQAAGNNDLAAQLAAQQSATTARTSDINAATTNFNVQNTAQNSQVQQALQNLSGSNAIDQNTLSMIQTALQGSIGQTTANNAGAGSAAALLSHTSDTTAQSLLASLLSKASGGSSGTGLLGDLFNGADSLLGGSGNANTDITNWLKGLFGGSDTSGVNGAGDSLAAGGLNGLGSASDAVGGIDGPVSNVGSGSGSGTDIGSIAGDAGTAYSGYNGISGLFGGSSGVVAGGTDAAAGGLSGLGSASDAIGAIDGPITSVGSGVGAGAGATSGAADAIASEGGSALSGATGISGAGLGFIGYVVASALQMLTGEGGPLGSHSAGQGATDDALKQLGLSVVPIGGSSPQSAIRSDAGGVMLGMGNNASQGSGQWFVKDASGNWNWVGRDGMNQMRQAASTATRFFNDDMQSVGKDNVIQNKDGSVTIKYPDKYYQYSSQNTPDQGYDGQYTDETLAPDGTITTHGYSTGYGPTTIVDTSLKDAYLKYGKPSGASLQQWLQGVLTVGMSVRGSPSG